MVYKKIKSISSISSLLLAGVLFGGGACGNNSDTTPSDSEQNQGDGNNQGNDGSNTVANTNTNNSNTNQANANTNTEASGGQKQKGEFDQFLAEAIKKFQQIFMKDCAGLGYLDNNPPSGIDQYLNLDEVASKSDSKSRKAAFSSTAKAIADLLSGARSFPVPPALKETFSNLPNVQQSVLLNKHPFALCTALAQILKRFNDFYMIKEAFLKSIDDCVLKASLPTLQKELADLESKIDRNCSPDYKFIDNAKGVHAILSGARLVRFFNGKSKRSTSYPEVERLMGKTIPECWVKFTPETGRTSTSITPEISSSTYLSRRGIPIVNSWEVEDGEKGDTFPQLNRINNTKYDNNPLSVKYFGVSGTDDSVSGAAANQSVLQAQAGTTSSAFNSEAAMISKNIQVGQLLFFTLAKGRSEHDFIELTPSNQLTVELNTNRIKISSKDDKYSVWKKEAQAGNEAFAEFLGKCIAKNPDLSNFFVVPDQDAIELAIFQDIDESKPANKGTDAQPYRPAANPDAAVPPRFAPESEVTKLFSNILEFFSASQQIIPSDKNKLFEKLKSLGGLESDSNFKKSDLTLNQRLLVTIAKKITTDPDSLTKLGSEADGSVKPVKDLVRLIINTELDKAIVKKKNGKYVPTAVTPPIKDALVLFDAQLDFKHSNASVTYDQIKDDAKISNQKFNIDLIRNQLIKDIQSFKAIIEVDPVPAIKTPVDQKVNYMASFQAVPGITPLVDKDFDQIRKDYHSKVNK